MQRGERSMRDTEFHWLLTHPEEIQKYPGEYIALVGESIVAHGKDFQAVLTAAEVQTGQEPFIYKVPPADREEIVHSTCEGAKANVPRSRDARVCVTMSGGRFSSVKGPGGSGRSTHARQLRGPQTSGSVGPKRARVVVPTAAARWVIPESCPTMT